MSVERTVTVDGIEVRPTVGCVTVREKVVTEVDGEESMKKHNIERHINPGDDISEEDPLVQTIVNAYWGTL